MTKVDIISGFLGAGKTTLIKKLIAEVFQGGKIVLIENEFGEIGVDGGFLKEAGIQVTEMNSGCICCSLVGDFGKALAEVIDKYAPERIIIEPSGVGKLSDVLKAVKDVAAGSTADISVGGCVTVVDAKKCKMYARNFGEFFNNQIENAATIVLSRTQELDDAKLAACVEIIKGLNPNAAIITTPWTELPGSVVMEAIDRKNSLLDDMLEEEHEHHHHHYDENGECCCGHHHDDDDDEDEDEHEHHHHHHHDDDEDEHEHEHHHHHHDDDEDEEEHEHHHHHHHDDDDDEDEHEHHHHHHHEDGEECSCGHHHDHHHHHADEVFENWGKETPKKYTEEQLKEILEQLSNSMYGIVLRAKGIICTPEGKWVQFDYVPGEYEIREGSADYTGRFCVIGSKLDREALEELF